MKVERMPLPGAATVVVFGVQRRVIVDAGLSRDEAALAITGVLPETHPDVVDHWLDTAFERRKLPFTIRQSIALFGASVAACAALLPHMLDVPLQSHRAPAAATAMAVPADQHDPSRV